MQCCVNRLSFQGILLGKVNGAHSKHQRYGTGSGGIDAEKEIFLDCDRGDSRRSLVGKREQEIRCLVKQKIYLR